MTTTTNTTKSETQVKLVISSACFNPSCYVGLSPGENAIMIGSYLFCCDACVEQYSKRPEGSWIKAESQGVK